MPEEYTKLVTALKALEKIVDPKTTPPKKITLKMAEDEWDIAPKDVSYGTVRLDFEPGALGGDDGKVNTAYEGSVDLFSKDRSGEGWVDLIKDTLTEYCGACWSLNAHMYERETGLFHWEWAFQVEE